MAEKLSEGIYRVCIPFENIYTSSFFLIENNNAIILDSGSNNDDAERYIMPQIDRLKVNVKYLVSSHTHEDHHGGIEVLKRMFPDAVPALFSKGVKDSHCLTDGEVLLDRFKMLNLKGHSDDSLGVLDVKNNILLSCDSLQLRGVGRYPTYFYDYHQYINTIERIRKLKPTSIIASHDYVPCGYIAKGRKEIEIYLEEAVKAAEESRERLGFK